MTEYDVIVVGAGPAGSAAAKVSAARGAKTIVLEEHQCIGLPQHCSGMMMGSKSALGTRILATMSPRVTLGALNARRIFSPSGRSFDISLEGKGAYLVDRALFDYELAGQAAGAGADILLNTKVTGLLTEGHTVVGVTTNRKEMAEVRAQIVIAADGIRALSGGLPVRAGLSENVTGADSGINMVLFNVKGVTQDVIELHVGPFGFHGFIWLQRNDATTCHAGFKSIEAFERCKRGTAVISDRLRNAVIAGMTGYSQQLTIFPGPLRKKVKSGILVAGAAANYPSFLLSYLSGVYAGEVAADAARVKDVSEKRLARYETMCTGLADPGWSKAFGFHSFINLSEQEQEEVFDQMTRADYVNFDVYDNL